MTTGTIPEIKTERLILRQMRDDDAPHLFEFFQDPKTSQFWFTPDKTLAETYARVIRLTKEWTKNGFGDWAIVDGESEKLIGFAGLHYIPGMEEVNLGYLLAHSCWGRGYGTEACLAVVRFGFDVVELKQIIGVTHPNNLASIRVLEKVGMTFWKEIVRSGAPRVVYSRRRTV